MRDHGQCWICCENNLSFSCELNCSIFSHRKTHKQKFSFPPKVYLAHFQYGLIWDMYNPRIVHLLNGEFPIKPCLITGFNEEVGKCAKSTANIYYRIIRDYQGQNLQPILEGDLQNPSFDHLPRPKPKSVTSRSHDTPPMVPPGQVASPSEVSLVSLSLVPPVPLPRRRRAAIVL